MPEPSQEPRFGKVVTAEKMLWFVLRDANKPDHPMRYWISRLERYGATDALIADINQKIRKIERKGWLKLYKTGHGLVLGVDHEPRYIINPGEEQFPYLVADLLARGMLKNLRRCARKECRNYFVRGPKARWCSDRCGSRIRNKEKRKRDRNNGALA